MQVLILAPGTRSGRRWGRLLPVVLPVRLWAGLTPPLCSQLYKRSYRGDRRHRQRSHEHFLPPLYHDPRGIFTPPPFFPPVPGIIGGEYDQRPNFPFGPPPQGILPRPRYDPLSPFPDLDRRPPTISGGAWQPGGGGANVRRGFI